MQFVVTTSLVYGCAFLIFLFLQPGDSKQVLFKSSSKVTRSITFESLLPTRMVCPYMDSYEDFPVQAEQWIDKVMPKRDGRGRDAWIKAEAHRLGGVSEPLIP